MTAVTSIIKSALRETNLIPLGVEPTTAQQTEAFELLTTIVARVPGGEAGENLNPLPLGGENIDSPAGYPWWNNELPANVYVRQNTRLMCNLTQDGYVFFDPAPHDGARMGIVDCALNFDIAPITLYGNGRLIDGEVEVTIDTPGTTKEWLYREDLGQWVTVTPIEIDGQMPWPSEFDDMFIVMLALRLNPRYGQIIHPASMEAYNRARRGFTARYSQSNTQMPSEEGLLYMTNLQTNRMYRWGEPNVLFDKGYPF